jgi:hypothetical protein
MISLCAVQNASLANCDKPCRTDQLHFFFRFSTLYGLYSTSVKKWNDEHQLYIIMFLWSSDQWVSPLYSISSSTKSVIWIVEVFDWSSSSSELMPWNQLVIKKLVFQIELTFKEPNKTYATVHTSIKHRIVSDKSSSIICSNSQTHYNFFWS